MNHVGGDIRGFVERTLGGKHRVLVSTTWLVRFSKRRALIFLTIPRSRIVSR